MKYEELTQSIIGAAKSVVKEFGWPFLDQTLKSVVNLPTPLSPEPAFSTNSMAND